MQVEDDGSDFTQVNSGGFLYGTNNSDIRLGANYIDGSSNTLAYGFYPGAGNNEARGNITFDSGESGFWNPTSFTIVAAHEIGHAIGIEHSADTNALMYPSYNPNYVAPTAGVITDDILAVRAIYGDETNQDNNLYMRDSNSALTLLEDFDGLIVNGTSGGDIINTAGGAQTILAGAGDDTITTGGGDDIISGGEGDDFVNGGVTPYNGLNSGFNTLIFSGSFFDYTFSTGQVTDAGGTYRVGILTDVNTTDGDDGTNTFVNINNLKFNDITAQVNIGTSASETLGGTNFDGDLLVGLEGADLLKGSAGDDFFNGGEGNDLIFGHSWSNAGAASDIDTAIYDGNITDYNFLAIEYTNPGRGGVISTGIVVTDDALGGVDGIHEGQDTLIDIDFIQFADGNIIDVNAIIIGTSASDTLVGDARNNIIVGQGGADTLTGNMGNDTFYFNDLTNSTSAETDLITDFTQGEDFIGLFELNIDFSDLIITNDGTDTTVTINDTGFELDLNGVIALTQDDFIL